MTDGPDPWLRQGAADMERVVLPRLGTVLKEYRHEHGLTQAALGELLQVDQTYVSMIERGRRQIRDVSFLLRICRLLDIPPADLGLSDKIRRNRHERRSPRAIARVRRLGRGRPAGRAGQPGWLAVSPPVSQPSPQRSRAGGQQAVPARSAGQGNAPDRGAILAASRACRPRRDRHGLDSGQPPAAGDRRRTGDRVSPAAAAAG